MFQLWLGVEGSGKTQGMQDHVAADVSGNCFFVRDFRNDWAATNAYGQPNPRWRGAVPRMWSAPPPPVTDELRRGLEVARHEGGIVRFPHPWTPRQVAQLALDVGDVVLVDDEIDELATYTEWEDNPVREIIHRGRGTPDANGVIREVHLLGAARRAQNIHIDLASLATSVCVFHPQGKRTIGRCLDEEWLTAEQVPIAQSFAVTRPGGPYVPVFEFFLWERGGHRSRGFITNPFPAF